MTVPPPAAAAYVPALIGAFCSVLCVRIGFLGVGFLYLLPLGIMASIYGGRTAWFCAFLAVLGNGILSLGTAMILHSWPGELGWDVLYFSVMAVAFTWIAAPPREGKRFLRPAGAYRLAAASLLGALSLTPMISSEGGVFRAFLQAQGEMLASLYTVPSGADVVQRSLIERHLTPQAITDFLSAAAVRGGMVVSCFVLLALSRQLALIIAGFVRRSRPAGGLAFFHVPPAFVWVLSCSLLGILGGLKLKLLPLEIAGWNVLVICSMLYLVQGGGILFFLLSRLPLPPVVRFLVDVLVIMAIVSPGINAVLLGVLVLLGIVENWVPFRAPKT